MLSPLGVASGVASIIDYFRPSKSPYLLVIAAGIGGIVLLCSNTFTAPGRFYPIAIPIYIVLLLLTHYSWRSVDSDWKDQKPSEAEGQLKFSRAICIICAVGCLVFASYHDVDDAAFIIIYFTSLPQAIVFVIYAAARLRVDEPVTSTNHFQIALVTSAFLIGATYCIYKADLGELFSSPTTAVAQFVQETDMMYLRDTGREYFISAVVFYVCWAWCQGFWLKRLKDIIHITIKADENRQSHAGAA